MPLRERIKQTKEQLSSYSIYCLAVKDIICMRHVQIRKKFVFIKGEISSWWVKNTKAVVSGRGGKV